MMGKANPGELTVFMQEELKYLLVIPCLKQTKNSAILWGFGLN